MNSMVRELNRVTLGLLVAFGIVALAAGFWGVLRADALRGREDNARNVIAQQRIQRGTIFDQSGTPLAMSQELPSGLMQRVYPYPETVAAVGYYSFRYGVTGLEAEYDSQLRGDTWRSAWRAFVDDALHRAEQGGDVRSTIDLAVQQAASQALGDYSGAVLVIDVPSGRVLAMASGPGYDPNTLDQQWDALTANVATSPLLNRATAGVYQPGGALETVVLAALLGAAPDLGAQGSTVLNAVVPDAADSVLVGDLTLACQPGAPSGDLTLLTAYAYGCPAAFALAFDDGLTPAALWDRFKVFGLLEAPDLPGFETAAGPESAPLTADSSPEKLVAALVGQGTLTVTPLQMAQVIATIANRGNGVPLHIVDAVRPPGKAWQPVEVSTESPALLRTDVAGALRSALRQSAAMNPALAGAARDGLVIYGHGGLAYGGPDATPDGWFVGFAEHAEGTTGAIAVVVVVEEDKPDAAAAANAAGVVFEAAAASLNGSASAGAGN